MELKDIEYSTSTALVTGGTSGIGRAIAFELASRGLRQLVLVARDEDKLAETAAELERTTAGLSVRTIGIDLSRPNAAIEVRQQVDRWNWHIDLLVNDAGFARKYVFAEDVEADTSLEAIDLMVKAVVDLTLRFLPGMVQRGRGGILNLGSTAGLQPVPFSAIYAASKAFVISFSQAIREENRETGVRVACIVPGVTDTNLDGQGHGERRGVLDKVGIDDPADVAKAAIDALESNAAAQIVGLNNKLLQAGMGLLPDAVAARLIGASRGRPEQD